MSFPNPDKILFPLKIVICRIGVIHAKTKEKCCTVISNYVILRCYSLLLLFRKKKYHHSFFTISRFFSFKKLNNYLCWSLIKVRINEKEGSSFWNGLSNLVWSAPACLINPSNGKIISMLQVGF